MCIAAIFCSNALLRRVHILLYGSCIVNAARLLALPAYTRALNTVSTRYPAPSAPLRSPKHRAMALTFLNTARRTCPNALLLPYRCLTFPSHLLPAARCLLKHVCFFIAFPALRRCSTTQRVCCARSMHMHIARQSTGRPAGASRARTVTLVGCLGPLACLSAANIATVPLPVASRTGRRRTC